MNGYIMNTSSTWMHAMKRAIGPGAKVPLSELFEQYGVKYNLSEGKEFVEWLRNVKLKDKNKWKIVFVESEENNVEVEEVEEVKDNKPAEKRTNDNVAPMVTTKLSVNDIVELSVRQARDVLPKIRDLNLLRYALQEANQRAGKDSLCNILRKHIKDLQMSR